MHSICRRCCWGWQADVNRSTAKEMNDSAFQTAIVPTARLLAEHLTRDVIVKRLGWQDLEFVFTDLDAPDQFEQAQIEEILLRNGVLTIDEVRSRRGLPPLTPPQIQEEVPLAGKPVSFQRASAERAQRQTAPGDAASSGSAGKAEVARMRLEAGSESNQDAARLEWLESMAIEMPEIKGHPNRVPFQGVLTLVDVPSDKPPSGSRGHRVLLTGKAVEEAIPSLLGMAVDYTPSLDGHDARAKIGVVTSAELETLPASRVLERRGTSAAVCTGACSN